MEHALIDFRVVDDATHQVTGLFVVEIPDVHPLEFIVCPCAEIAHQVPCRLMGEVVA